MRILDAKQTAEALPYARLVPAIAQAAIEKANGAILAPERQIVRIGEGSTLLSMPAIGADLSVTKLITVHVNNAAKGLPAIQGEVIVFDTRTGRRLALLDAPVVTARRTAAVSLLGIQRLAKKVPESVLIIGTGTQAAAHADAFISFLGIRQFWVKGRDRESEIAFCNRLQDNCPGVSARPAIPDAGRTASMGVDLVIALTTSRETVIPADLEPHVLAIGVGAFTPEMAEFPAQLLHARPIVVDDRPGAEYEAGDLIRAKIDWSSVRELSELTDGDRAHAGLTPVLKTVGQAAWDLAAARVIAAAL